MKKLSILVMVVMFASCELTTSHITALTVLADRTDPVIPSPSVADILPLLELETFPNSGVSIKFQNIGSVDYSPTYGLELQTASLLDNTLQRKSDVAHFIVTLDTLISTENKREYNYQNSSILMPLIEHLKKLNSLEAYSKSVILYSDLSEFSDLFDSYGQGQYLLENPLKVAQELKSELNIPTLEGITLNIIHYPKTQQDNRMFRAWCDVYRELFKDTGLKIQIGMDKTINQKR